MKMIIKFYILFILGLFLKDITGFIKYVYLIININNNNKLDNLYNNMKIIIYKYKLNNISFYIKWIFIVNIFYYFYNLIYMIIMMDNVSLIYMSEDSSQMQHKNLSENKGEGNINLKTDSVNNTNNTISPDVNVNNINLNTPNVKINVPGAIPAIIGGAAIKGGIELSKNIPTVGGKIAVASIGTVILAAGATFGNKIGTQLGEQFNSLNNNPSGSDTNKYLDSRFFDFSSLTGHVEGLDKYPLNLLQDMNILNISAISLLFIVLNVFIAIYITQNKIDIFKYLSKWLEKTSKLGSVINYLFNRYINLWYNSRVFILIYCWCMLLICLIINQTGFLIILNSG